MKKKKNEEVKNKEKKLRRNTHIINTKIYFDTNRETKRNENQSEEYLLRYAK